MTDAASALEIASRLRAIALGRGVGTEGARIEGVALACRALAIDPRMDPVGLAAVIVHAALTAPSREVGSPADAVLALAECALAACLDAEAGLAPSPWIADVVARCDRALHGGDA